MENAKFPVPEAEAEKLDVVEERLEVQPVLQKLDDAIRANPWPYVAGAALLGFLCGAALSRR